MNKIKEIQKALEKKYFERDQEIEGLLIALLAKQHVLFIGEAGTGKSMLSSELNNIIEGSSYFQWLLSQFTTPEELFGPISLNDLERGIYKRITANKLPEAHFAFLDEIFKSNSSILNSLLTLINERVFYNNGSPVSTPLVTIVGSSNEYPEEGEGLEALFDRFLLRYEVDYINDGSNFISLLKGENNVQVPTMTMTDLLMSQLEVEQVEITDDIYRTLTSLREDLKYEGIRPSDRRFVQSLKLLKAKAYLEDRQVVIRSDINILRHTLWVKPDQRYLVGDIVSGYSVDENLALLEERKKEVKALVQILNDPAKDSDEKLETVRKLNSIRDEVANLTVSDEKKATQLLDLITKELENYAESIVRLKV